MAILRAASCIPVWRKRYGVFIKISFARRVLVKAPFQTLCLVCSSRHLPFFTLLFTHRFLRRSIVSQELVTEGRKGSRAESSTYLAGQAQHVPYIVYTPQAIVKL